MRVVQDSGPHLCAFLLASCGSEPLFVWWARMIVAVVLALVPLLLRFGRGVAYFVPGEEAEGYHSKVHNTSSAGAGPMESSVHFPLYLHYPAVLVWGVWCNHRLTLALGPLPGVCGILGRLCTMVQIGRDTSELQSQR